MSDNKMLGAFSSIFRGNTSSFVKHQPPFRKEEGGKVKPKYCLFSLYESKHNNPPPKGFEEGDFEPLTLEHYRAHLNGGNGLAVSPIANVTDEQGNVIKRNVCYFAVIDVDVYGVNFSSLIIRLYKFGLQFMPVMSKSGGVHLYFFFRGAEQAGEVIETLSRLVEIFGLNRLYVNGNNKSKVEIFPKQSTLIPGGKHGSCIFLPFYNSADPKKTMGKAITADGKLVGIQKAIPIIDSMFTTLENINYVLDTLPYSDAPFCIQMVLLTGALGENDGRNNFLCCCAIYLKKKYTDSFYDSLAEMNNCFEHPLEQRDVDSVYKSISEGGFENYWCNKSPMCDYCDKKLCKLREYGKGREKKNKFTGAYQWGEITKYSAGGGKEPYYVWRVQTDENEPFREVQVDSHKDLMNQSVVQANCLRDLDWIPKTVSPSIWHEHIMKSLEGIKERTITVADSGDTTESSMLKEAFYKFLTHRRTQRNGQPYMVRMNQVYHVKGDGYYFTSTGFMKYAKFENLKIRENKIRDYLKDWKCQEDVELKYETSSGSSRVLNCWKMPDSDFLKDMDVFYDELYEDQAEIISRMGNYESKEAENGDHKF